MARPGGEVPDTTELRLDGSDKTFQLGTISASSVSVQIGSKFGFLTYVLDVVKIFVPTLLFRVLLPEHPYFLVVAAAGVVGHVWPVFYRFKGGRGISAVYGGMFAIDWIGVFVAAAAGLRGDPVAAAWYLTRAAELLLEGQRTRRGLSPDHGQSVTVCGGSPSRPKRRRKTSAR